MNTRISTPSRLRTRLSLFAVLVPVTLTATTRAAEQLYGWGSQTSVPGEFIAVAAGYQHSLAIRTNGTLAAWACGALDYGQCDLSWVLPGDTFKAVSGGGVHSLAIRDNGTLVAWGCRGSGNFGQCDFQFGTFKAVAAGTEFSLAIRADLPGTDGTLVGWGRNDTGQTDVPFGTFTAVAAGRHHGLAIRSDGTLAAWGCGDKEDPYNFGQCDLDWVLPGEKFKAVAASVVHSLAIRSDGTLVAWGCEAYDYGQCADPTGTFTAVAAGFGHSLAIRDDGTLAGWGNNFYGQTNVPPGKFTAVAAGGSHSLAIGHYRIHSVEFTQAIQTLQTLEKVLAADPDHADGIDWNPPVPIVALKPAVMRVYFNDVTKVTKYHLYAAFVDSTEAQHGEVSHKPGCIHELQRLQKDGCESEDFYFTPPVGPWFVVLAITDEHFVELERHKFNLTSKKSKKLVLRSLDVCDSQDPDGKWHCGFDTVFTLSSNVGLLKKIAPTDEVVLQITGHEVKGELFDYVNGDGDSWDCVSDGIFPNINQNLGNKCEPTIWWQLVARAIHDLYGTNQPTGGIPGQETYYYGMVRPGVPGNIAGMANAITSRGAAGQIGRPQTLAHETGHMMGRLHTNTGEPALSCSLPEHYRDPNWGYSDNRLRSGVPPFDVLEVGFDVEKQKALPQMETFEIMGYCSPSRWISAKTTLGMLQVLAEPSTPAPTPAAALGQFGSYWRLSGIIEGGAAGIDPIFTFDTEGPTEAGSGTHRIEVLDAEENVLFTRLFTPITPIIETELDEPSPEGTPFFSEMIPIQADAASIVVIGPSGAMAAQGGATLGQVALGGTAPTVTITFPEGGENFDGTETATWTVTDPDSTNHMFQVHYSADGGVTWSSQTSAESGLSLVLDFNDLPGSQEEGSSLIRVMASDGVNTGTAVSNPFSVAKKLPSAKIIFPLTNAGFASKTLVLLQAMGFDADEGLLTDNALQWSSDADGPLGSGDDLPVYDLSPGRHTITLTVTDGDANIATDEVTVFVFDEPTADGDFDTDVDLDDFGRFGRCLAGPRTTPGQPACRIFDFDADGDVDAADFAVFQNYVGEALQHSLVVGWGNNDFGQTTVPSGTFTAVTAGSYHSLAIRSDGTLVGWGRNNIGQTTVPSGTFTAVAAGSLHGLAIRSDGTLAGWGWNSSGQIIVPAGAFTGIAAGGEHSLAIRSDGTLVGWGNNDYGQINVPSGTFTAIAAGYYHSLAIRSDGTLAGWGNNSYGQITVPAGAFTGIAAGGEHSLAIRTDGTLVGWGAGITNTGYPHYGQAMVPTGTFTAVAAGSLHSLAIRSDGTLVGWGDNSQGQIDVPSGTFTAVAAGSLHSLATNSNAPAP